MTKAEFLLQLKKELAFLPEQETEKALSFYSEAIDDRIENGLTEEEATADLGDMKKIIQEIQLELPISSLVKNKIKNSHKNSGSKTLWIVLAVCGSPLWIPLALTFVLLIFTFYLVIWTIIAAIYAVLLGFAAACIGGVAAGILRTIFISPANGLMIAGAAIVCGGLFLLLLRPVNALTKKLIYFTAVCAKKIKSLFITKKEAV